MIPVAAGCLVNERAEVLVCQRPAGKIAAGKWEFPGGKIEPGESAEQALRRELREELGVEVDRPRPLLRVRHDYRDRTVELDVWRVEAWRGEPRPLDFQGLAWVLPGELVHWDLLAADLPIVRALQLPPHCIFTPPGMDGGALARSLPGLPPALLRLRQPGMADGDYAALALAAAAALRGSPMHLVVDRPTGAPAAGLHLDSRRARTLDARPPLAPGCWLGVSCHAAGDLAHARAIGADYAVLGPVLPTTTHPGAATLGWERFAVLAAGAGLPIYAIGGLGPQDLETARRHGAHGVAGISGYWRGGPSGGGSRSGSSSGIE